MTDSWPRPTRADHSRFVRCEGWHEVPSTHHQTFELVVADGRTLRTRTSRPPDRTTYGARLAAHILRDQLDVTVEQFFACVRRGIVPDRTADTDPTIEGSIPAEVAELLVTRVGLRRADLVGMTREDAIARLTTHWTTGR